MNGLPNECSEDTAVQISIPDFELCALAHLLLPKIQKFFEAEENRQAFEQWQSMPKK